jgi:HEAT repeat protein
MLTDRSWTVRRAVIASLAAIGDPAVDALCTVLREGRDDETRIAAAMDALADSIGQPRHALVELTADESPALVADAAAVLGRRRDSGAVDALIRLLGHRDDNVAVAAIEALGRIGGRRAVDALLAIVTSGRFFRVFPAMDVLGRSGDPRAVGPLAHLLAEPLYSADAARALAHTADRSAVAPLASLLDRPADAQVRIGAEAIADLRERYRERYGKSDAIDDLVRRAASVPAACVRLTAAASGATSREQVAIASVLGVLGGETAASTLMHMLEAPEPVASAAAAALELVGAAADLPVRRALREGDSVLRRSMLALIDRPSALEEVLLCLSDSDPAVRSLACDALARLGNPSSVRQLFRALSDPSPAVAQAAIAAIQTLGGADTDALARAAARSESPRVRRAALGILAYFGRPDAFDLFAAALDDPEESVREAAVVGLPYIDGARAVDALIALAHAPAARTRAVAMRAFPLCSFDPRATAALMKGLSDRDAWVRYYACQAIGRMRHEAAGDKVAALLDDPAGQVRIAAIESLSHLRSPMARAVLEEAARSHDPDLRRAALVGVGIARHPGALPILIEAARSRDSATRLIAVSSLASFDSDDALATLAAAVDDSHGGVRTAALSVLAASSSPAAVEILVGRLRRDPDEAAAARALATPAPGRIDELVRSLERADDDLAMMLTSALARMRGSPAATALVAAMSSHNPAARRAAASCLISLGTVDARAAVERASREDPDPEVRGVCALLLLGE